MADDILELLFKVTTADDGGLNRVDAAVKKIGQDSGLTGAALQNLEAGVRKSFESMVQSGLTFEQALKRISQSGDTIGRGVGNIAKDMVKALNDAAAAAGNLQQRQQQLQQSAAGLQSALGNPLQAIGTVATNTAAALGPLGIAIIGLATVSTLGAKAMFDLVDAQGRAAQATLIMANQLGISAGSMRQMEVEAKIVGLSFQSMMIASRNLAVGLEDPTGAGRNAAKALTELGVATQTASGAVRGEGQVFQDAIEQLAGIEDQSKRTEEATRLFGWRGSASLVALIARYKELKQAAEELGYASSDELVQEMAKGQESINKLSAAWDLFTGKLARKINPIVITLLQNATNLVDGKAQVQTNIAPGYGGFGPIQNRTEGGVLDVRAAIAEKVSQALAALGMPEAARMNQQGAAAIAGGKSITDKFNAEYAKTSDGLAARLRENSDALKKVTDKLALGGLDQGAASALSAQAASLEQQRASLEAQKKALEQSRTEVSKLREDSKYPDLQSPVEFRRLIAERQRELSVVGPGNEKLVDSSPAFGTDKINEAIRKFFEKIGEEIQKDAAGVVKEEDRYDRNDPDSEAYKKQLKDNLDLATLQYDQSQKQLKIFDESDRDAARSQREMAVKLAQLSGGGGAGSINAGAQVSIQDSQQQFADRMAEIAQEADAYRQEGGDRLTLQKQLGDLATQQLQAEAELRKEIDAAQMDAAVKLAEYQKEQLESYKQQGEQIFDALRQRGGIQQYFRGQITDLARGVFGNITAPVLQQIGRSLGSAGSAIGGSSGIFRGTALDPSRADSPQVRSLDLNRLSLDRNTEALGSVTRFYSGGSGAAGSQAPAAAGAPTLPSILRTPPFLPASTGSAAADPIASIAGILGGAPAGSGPVASAASTLAGALSSNTDATNKLTATYSGTPVGGQSGTVQTGSVGAGLTKLVGGGGSDNQVLDGLRGIFNGKGGIGGGGLFAGLNPDAGMTGGYRAGNIIGSAADIGTGIYESVNQFSKGGASGILGGLGAASLTAGQLAGGPSNPVGLGLDIFGGITELFKSLFPSAADIRAAQIANQTAYNQYVAPPQINQSLNQNGFQTYTDKTGQVQASAYSSIQETQPYKYLSPIPQPIGSLYQNWVSAPGQIIEPYQAPAATPTYAQQPGTTYLTTVNLQSWDSSDVGSFVNKNSSTFASAVQKEVQNGHPVGLALQSALVGN